MNAVSPVLFSMDADGIGWITFDDPSARVNVLHSASQHAFSAALDAATRSPAKAVVIVSSKARAFIAGADLKEVAALTEAPVATEFSRTGQRLFSRLAVFPIPVVCAIHGACAGGGYEVALACHWRLASDAPETRIGLPETSLGTIPGWGGGVRLPRLIGVQAALAHLLQGQLLRATDALRAGLVDEVVCERELKLRAKAAAVTIARTGQPVRLPPPGPPRNFYSELREKTLTRSRGHLPALMAAIDVVEHSADLSLPAALDLEARLFGEITTSPACKNLLHAFAVREAARKQTLTGWFDRGEPAPVAAPTPAGNLQLNPIARVGVVGAGVMGSGIAHWLATQGCEVVLRDVQPDCVVRGLGAIRKLFDEAVVRGRLPAANAGHGMERISATTGWDGFSTCDLVIEAIVEDAAAKRSLFRELDRVVSLDAILASNTSALPIEEIAGQISHPERTVGLHFFNPVSRMPLVELVIGRHTSAVTAERALAFVKALGKTPVVCRSSPGFLMTRILFFYLNAAVQLWEEGVATDVLDDAMRDFGWPMGPLRLIDEVGLDVTDFIFGEMAHYFPARFHRSTACGRLLAAGLRGRKNGTGAGFYLHDARTERVNDNFTRMLLPAPVPSYRMPDEIIAHLMDVMIDEAHRCLAEGVVRSPDEVDFALLSGAGFPAFRGGLMRFARTRLRPPATFPAVLTAAS